MIMFSDLSWVDFGWEVSHQKVSARNMQIKARASAIKDWHDGERESSGTEPRRSGYSENAGWFQQSTSQFLFYFFHFKGGTCILHISRGLDAHSDPGSW